LRSGVLSPAGGRALTGSWLSGGRWSLSRRRANCVAPASRAAVMIATRTVNPSEPFMRFCRWSENDDHNYGLADFGHGASGSLFFLAGSARCPHRGGMDVHVERLDKTPQFPGHDRELCRVGHFVSVRHEAVRIGSRVCRGALCLLLGLLTQIFAPMLVVVMLLRRSEPSGVSSILWKRCSASRRSHSCS
jgi:hypothetical protein